MNRRNRNLWTFLIIFSSIVILGHAYIYARLISQVFVSSLDQVLATGFLIILASTVLIQPFVPRVLNAKVYFLRATAYFWLGASFVLVTSLCLVDAISALADQFDLLAEDILSHRTTAAIFIFVLLFGYGLMQARMLARVRAVKIRLPRWPSEHNGFSIVQISDLHLSNRTRKRLPNELIRKVNSLNADLIVLTGDMVDGPLEELAELASPLGNFKSKYGTFFVTGNHDHYSGADEWCDYLSTLGITVLRNARVEPGSELFCLAGVDDYRGDWRKGSTCDLGAAIEGWSRKTPMVLLSHNPVLFEESAALGIDLQLSGHTHGGQVWPFHMAVRATTPFVSGLYRKKESTLYVSRGTGYWGPAIRLGAPSEITQIFLYQE